MKKVSDRKTKALRASRERLKDAVDTLVYQMALGKPEWRNPIKKRVAVDDDDDDEVIASQRAKKMMRLEVFAKQLAPEDVTTLLDRVRKGQVVVEEEVEVEGDEREEVEDWLGHGEHEDESSDEGDDLPSWAPRGAQKEALQLIESAKKLARIATAEQRAMALEWLKKELGM